MVTTLSHSLSFSSSPPFIPHFPLPFVRSTFPFLESLWFHSWWSSNRATNSSDLVLVFKRLVPMQRLFPSQSPPLHRLPAREHSTKHTKKKESESKGKKKERPVALNSRIAIYSVNGEFHAAGPPIYYSSVIAYYLRRGYYGSRLETPANRLWNLNRSI